MSKFIPKDEEEKKFYEVLVKFKEDSSKTELPFSSKLSGVERKK